MLPSKSLRDLLQFGSLVIQLGLILLALWRFHIEYVQRFEYLLPLIFFGFIINHFIPRRFRHGFFLALSLLGIVIVLPFPLGVILIALGLGLIGLCHLPISLGARVALVLLATAGLAALRAGWLSTPQLDQVQQVVLPVLAAMFMFRLAIYLYE